MDCAHLKYNIKVLYHKRRWMRVDRLYITTDGLCGKDVPFYILHSHGRHEVNNFYALSFLKCKVANVTSAVYDSLISGIRWQRFHLIIRMDVKILDDKGWHECYDKHPRQCCFYGFADFHLLLFSSYKRPHRDSRTDFVGCKCIKKNVSNKGWNTNNTIF